MGKTLYIPELGDELKLTNNWAFTLYSEYRNAAIWAEVTKGEFKYKYSPTGKLDSVQHMLPKGTVLAVDRIYIRKGASDFSSISFRIISHPVWTKEKRVFGTKQLFRFWAKLADCNTIQFEQVRDITKEVRISRWSHTLYDVNAKGHIKDFFGKSTHILKNKLEGFGYVNQEKAIKMEITYDITWHEHTEKFGLFGKRTYWTSKVHNIKYKIFDLNNELIGEHNTFSKAKKNAVEHLNKK